MSISAVATRLKLGLSFHVPVCVSRMILIGFCYRVLDLFGQEHNRDYCLGVKW